MRHLLLASVAFVVFAICMPIVGWAQAPALRGGHHRGGHHHHGATCASCAPAAACACDCMAPAPVATPVCVDCGPCMDACGACGSCSNLCSNWPEFYRQLYAEFYARNPWYLEQKAKELAERRARLHLTNRPAPIAP